MGLFDGLQKASTAFMLSLDFGRNRTISARGNIFTYAVHRQYIASTLQIRVQEELKEQGRGSLM